MNECRKPSNPDEMTPDGREKLARVQERNERRRKGILRGEDFHEWEDYKMELETKHLMEKAA